MAALAWGAAAQTSLEYPVKASYLVRFAAFAAWPDNAFQSDAPLVICVVGQDPFGPILDRAAAAQTANGRALAVRRPDSSDLAGCHIAYLGRDAVAPATPLPSLLLVTDETVAARRGAIHFVIVQGRVRFHIDQRQTRAAGVGLNSRLLGLALSVRGE
jgi:hypothetical protein